jgi:tRNA(adenine34) deaminase
MDHSIYLKQALKQAIKAQIEGQNPIGCVIIDENGKIIARAHNEVAKRNDRTAHAEMLAIKKANKYINGENIRKWTLYTTMEPCLMCMGTIIMAHIGIVVWGTNDVLIKAHTILNTNPYLRTRKLVTIACPDTELEKQCRTIHEEYWISHGRPDAIRPIIEEPEMP